MVHNPGGDWQPGWGVDLTHDLLNKQIQENEVPPALMWRRMLAGTQR